MKDLERKASLRRHRGNRSALLQDQSDDLEKVIIERGEVKRVKALKEAVKKKVRRKISAKRRSQPIKVSEEGDKTDRQVINVT